MGEKMMNELGLKPIGGWWLVCQQVCIRALWASGLWAIPKVMKQANMNLSQIDLIE
jgi:hypothetical protein